MSPRRALPALSLAALIASPWLVCPGQAGAAIIEQIGTGGPWPTNWTPIAGLNDGAGDEGTFSSPIPGRIDFIGNAVDPAAYYANEGGYLFFRMRMNTPTVVGTYSTGATRTYKDTVMVIIDVVGSHFDVPTQQLVTGETSGQANKPDYGFAWDANLAPAFHGLEMMASNNTYFGAWSLASMEDLDKAAGSKGVNDINGAGRTTDGYVRTVDQQASTGFGTTTFIDFAVAWNYLNTYTGLRQGQDWNITLATIQNGNDHSNISADVAGGTSLDENVTETDWTPFNPVPVPASLPLLGIGLAALGWARRRAA